MKRGWPVCGLVCLGMLVAGARVGRGQSAGSIVGWGSMVIVEQSALEHCVAVAAGRFHSLGVRSDGSIVAWGRNDRGQCNVPEASADFVAVAAGGFHSLGVTSDGRISAWGDNTGSQLNVPAPNADFVAVAAGEFHSLGLKSYGTIVAWGGNYYVQ